MGVMFLASDVAGFGLWFFASANAYQILYGLMVDVLPFDVFFGLFAVLCVMFAVLEALSEGLQHGMAALISMIELILFMPLSYELDLTRFGTSMPMRLPLDFYILYGSLVIGFLTAYVKGTRLSLKTKVFTKLATAAPLTVWVAHLLLYTIFGLMWGYFQLWWTAVALVLLIINVWLMATVKPFLSRQLISL